MEMMYYLIHKNILRILVLFTDGYIKPSNLVNIIVLPCHFTEGKYILPKIRLYLLGPV